MLESALENSTDYEFEQPSSEERNKDAGQRSLDIIIEAVQQDE